MILLFHFFGQRGIAEQKKVAPSVRVNGTTFRVFNSYLGTTNWAACDKGCYVFAIVLGKLVSPGLLSFVLLSITNVRCGFWGFLPF
jgi:hypothetical protein